MSIVAKNLIEAGFAPNVQTTVYTTPGSTRTILDKCTATNTDSAAQTLTINIVGSGGTVGTSNVLVQAKSIAAGQTYDFSELQNQILNAGDFIAVLASSASKVVLRLSGRECT